MSPKKVLVSGAAGFIGRWSVPPLIAAGYEVHAVSRTPPRALPPQLRGAVLHGVDLLDDGASEALEPGSSPRICCISPGSRLPAFTGPAPTMTGGLRPAGTCCGGFMPTAVLAP